MNSSPSTKRETSAPFYVTTVLGIDGVTRILLWLALLLFIGVMALLFFDLIILNIQIYTLIQSFEALTHR